MEYVYLSNGVKLPSIGMGTYPLKGLALSKIVRDAYKVGYEYFDTSASYLNEKDIRFGRFLAGREAGKKMIIGTKISNNQQRTISVEDAFNQSQKKLGIEQIDVYLMHWPNPETFINTWKGMEDLYLQGKVKAIGVCNCHIHHLESIFEIARVKPMINQVELHPLLSQQPLLKFCRENNIIVEAYTPLARMDKKLIESKILINIAQKHKKKVTQIILRWDIQNGVVPIPKSSTLERLTENISVFDFALSCEEMAAINSINIDYRTRFDPDNCDYSKL